MDFKPTYGEATVYFPKFFSDGITDINEFDEKGKIYLNGEINLRWGDLGVEVRILKQNLTLKTDNQNDPMSKMMITILSMFAEFERDIISQRTKEALKSLKNKGISLGKPKNTIQKSIFDKDQEKIVELLGLGLSYQKVVEKHLGYGSASTLHTYVKKRNLLVA